MELNKTPTRNKYHQEALRYLDQNFAFLELRYE